MLERADLSDDQLAIFSEMLPESFKRAQKHRLPFALAFLERMAHACNHDVELHFTPRLRYDGSLIELLKFAQANLWTALQQNDSGTRFIDANERVMAIVQERELDTVEIFLTPHGQRAMHARDDQLEEITQILPN